LIDSELIERYTVAKYIVDNNGMPVRLRVGALNIEVDNILAQYEATTAYFITPENPFSQELTEEENRLRHERFITVLTKSNFTYLTGYGTNEDESWTKENSYLVISSDVSAVHTLAANFGQNGILKVENGKPVSLLLLDGMSYLDSTLA